MALEIEELKKLHDRAYTNNQVAREQAANDLVFYTVTHWDDNILMESQLSFRGQFDVLKKAGRDIMSELDQNRFQIDFEPKDENRDDSAELLDGLYRSSDNDNQSVESYEKGQQESVICGFGAWELYNEYENMDPTDTNQIIKRRPILEANNTVMWDPNSTLMDKSDAFYVSCLTPYSHDGYKKLVKDLTGEDLGDHLIKSVNGKQLLNATIPDMSFKYPEISYSFPWLAGSGSEIWVTNFYWREKIDTKVLIMVDVIDQQIEVREKDLLNVMDEMLDYGYEIRGEKKIQEYQVTKYIASGAEILSESIVPGGQIPVIPMYGEHSYVEGEEYWEGVTRLAKDPQRLRNFQLSYLADISSRSPREKPIFLPEQIRGHEHMYELSGSENNFPYILQNRSGPNGEDLPAGPVGNLPAPNIPPALVATIELSRQAIEDVANPGVPQNLSDPDLSGKAVLALEAKISKQTQIYQKHFKHAKRRDAVVFAAMASELYDVPRQVTVTRPDGKREKVHIMQSVVDRETGEIVTINDIRKEQFDVYGKIGPDYTSQKEQTNEMLGEMSRELDPGDPMKKALQLKRLVLADGVEFDDIRDYANKQLVLSGFREPENEDEEALLAQVQGQSQAPDAEMVLAMAEMKKGQAQELKAYVEQSKLVSQDLDSRAGRQIDAFKAETDRMNTAIDAREAGAKIENTSADTVGKSIENMQKLEQFQIPTEQMTDDELYEQLIAG